MAHVSLGKFHKEMDCGHSRGNQDTTFKINESSCWAIEADMTTEVDNKATVLTFVQCISQEDMHACMFCGHPLTTNTKAAKFFKSLHDYTPGN